MIKFRNIMCIILLCSIVSAASIKTTQHFTKKPEIHYIKISKPILPKNPINDDSVLYQIKKLKIKYPKIALAQAKLESNNYKSELFKRNNNMFGMTLAHYRPTTAIKNGKYAKYENYVACITDYALMQSTFLKTIKSETDYYNYLQHNYASDKNYVKKIKFIVDTL